MKVVEEEEVEMRRSWNESTNIHTLESHTCMKYYVTTTYQV